MQPFACAETNLVLLYPVLPSVVVLTTSSIDQAKENIAVSGVEVAEQSLSYTFDYECLIAKGTYNI